MVERTDSQVGHRLPHLQRSVLHAHTHNGMNITEIIIKNISENLKKKKPLVVWLF